jgi:hypothetical protein
MFLSLFGCTLPSSSQEQADSENLSDKTSDSPASSNSSNSSDSSNSSSTQDEESFEQQLENHALPLTGNPVIGTYRTSGGVLLTLTEAGEYRWQEQDYLVKGEYQVSEGTVSGDGYILESETGPLYTVIVKLQTTGDFEEGQIAPNVEASILVFDFYSTDVWRVTELMTGVQFEATRE